MKNKKILALLASAVLAFGASAYAQSFTAVCDSQNKEVKVTIKPDAEYSAPITVYLTTDGVKVEDINAQNINSTVWLFSQVEKGANGYQATLKLPEGMTTGFYTFTVEDYGAKDDTPVVALADRQCKIYIADTDEVTNAIKAVNDASTVDALNTAFTTYANALGIDTADDFGTSTNTAFIALRGSKAYTTMADIQSDYAVAQAVGGLTDAKASAMGDKLKRYADILGIKLDENYTKHADAAHKLMEKYFDASAIDKDVKTTYAKLAREAIAVAAINNTDRSGIDEVLNAYNDVFGVDLDGKYATTNKTSFNKALERKSFADAAAVKKAFDAAVKELGKSSGGGSSSSGSSSIKYEPKNEENNDPTNTPGVLNDLSQAEWARKAIERLYKKGIVSGYEDGSYKPNNIITRNEVLSILVRAFDLMDDDAVYDFTDGDPLAWYARAVASARKRGIISGYDDGSFGDGAPVTRQDMAVFVYRMGGFEKSEGNSFTDSDDIADYAEEAVDSLAAAGIINGMGDGTFAPNEPATRAQFTKIISDIMGGEADE